MLEKLKLNKKLLKELDFGILVTTIIIVIFGSINIYSASQSFGAGAGAHYFKTQLMWLAVGLAVVYIILLIDYTTIIGYANIIYWFSIFLLVLNDTVFKNTINGASAWMKIGSISVQPSEFAKLAMIIMIAKKLNDMDGNINNIKNLFTLIVYALIPMLLIVIQPDMGMTMVCFFIVLGMFFAAGLDLKVIFGGLASLAGLVAVIWNSPLMQEYWKSRLLSFIHPESDELGAGLQLDMSKTAIGSGGLKGSGFLKGAMTSAGRVPEGNTDLIFSAVGEEWGFIGAVVLLFLYGIIIFKLIKIAKASKDTFGSILCVGVISSMLFSIYQNIGMAIGIAPISGLTLPFMSYGGSSMLTNFMALGLALNVGMRRKKINF
jgi:rod shape determining protein RodA